MASGISLFVYGTLLDESRLRAITGKSFPACAATLKKFKKLQSRFGYPYILPRRGSKVEGILIRDLDPRSMKKLDEYEGRHYSREKVFVISDGKRVLCEVYVGNRIIARESKRIDK